MPELLVHGIRQSLEPDKDDLLAAQQQTSLVRDAVPAANRDCFDELLAEARLVHSLRDERDLYTDSWAAGVARRGFLVAGQRVAAAGRIAAAEDLLNASVDEMRQLLFGEAGAPSGDALHARGLQRQEIDLPAAPPSLGEPPAPRLAGFFPTDMERVARALDAVLGAMFATPPPQTETRMVRGVGASGGIYEGIARKVKDASDLERVRQGDIVIAEMTSASFNMVLPLLGAVVTSRGGVLSHAAIMSREFGIPAVVGTTDAMLVIPEGVRVRVNGNTGEVAVLA
jgi:pyruvate,water dikinase